MKHGNELQKRTIKQSTLLVSHGHQNQRSVGAVTVFEFHSSASLALPVIANITEVVDITKKWARIKKTTKYDCDEIRLIRVKYQINKML
ncbi:Hypothetical predicted protein [Octopus vulgaris]|uniref:Uncharacterized protein n=1 Tax=Octopus vulgaris TaxID=6645 RepID=A0AA36BKZ6_OCTVU|nr:Hypothetical predicted protein [Octopus vulgaris]